MKKTIAILEPHEILLGCLEEVLVHLNYEVIVKSGSSLDFIEQLAVLEQLPDVILSEFELTDLPDISLFRHLRHHYPEVPILAFSGDSSEFCVEQALSEGATGFLEKGCSLQLLQDILDDISVTCLKVESNGILSK